MSEKLILDNGNCPVLRQLYEYTGRTFDYDDYIHIEEMVNDMMKDSRLLNLQKEITVLKERLEEIRMITRRVYHV